MDLDIVTSLTTQQKSLIYWRRLKFSKIQIISYYISKVLLYLQFFTSVNDCAIYLEMSGVEKKMIGMSIS